MKRLTIILLLISTVFAYTEFDASSYYKKANDYYKENLYRNALRDVHIAKQIYSNLSKACGRCDSLISAIDGEITPALAASYYYDITSDYFVLGLDVTDDYRAVEYFEYTKIFGRLAIKKYEGIGDDYGVTKANDIVIRAGNEIMNRMSVQRQIADGYYEKAYTSYVSKRYLDAISYAQNASLVYNQIGDENGIIKGDRLLSDIQGKVNEIKKNADTTYLSAKKKYSDEDYRIALDYAKTTLELYTLISNEEGISKANDLISVLKRILEMQEEEKLKQAEQFKKIAKEEFVHMNYENASEYVKKVKSIYREFYEKAYRDKNERDKEYWFEQISEVDVLHRHIMDEWGGEQARSSADRYYDQSQAFFLAKQYNEALNYARKAKNIFFDIEFWVGVERAEALMRTIGERVSQEQMADGNLTLASDFCRGADFISARDHLEISKQLYEALLGLNRTVELEEVTACITNGEEKAKEAKEYFNKGYNSYQLGDYRDAKKFAEIAINSYKEINYSLGMNETMDLYNKANKEVRAMNARLRNMILSIGIVVIVVVIIAVRYRKRKEELEEKAEKVEEEREKIEELEKKKWEVKKEEVTEEKVKEELRKIIEDERKSMGE